MAAILYFKEVIWEAHVGEPPSLPGSACGPAGSCEASSGASSKSSVSEAYEQILSVLF